MRYKLPVLILLPLVAVLAEGQSGGLDSRTLAAIEEALRNIALTNHSVENLIYDGMTVEDVEAVLQEDVAINHDSFDGEYLHYSAHGNYLVFWSEARERYNPVVIGFMRRGETRIRHNYGDNVR